MPQVDKIRQSNVCYLLGCAYSVDGDSISFSANCVVYFSGRIVAIKTKSIKANQCLTSSPLAGSKGVLYAKLAPCGSDTEPPTNQSWAYRDSDGLKEIDYVSNITLKIQ